MNIHTVGCVDQARNFINGNLYVIFGAGGGLLVFQLLAVILSASLAAGVWKEKKLAQAIKKSNKLKDKYRLQKLK